MDSAAALGALPRKISYSFTGIVEGIKQIYLYSGVNYQIVNPSSNKYIFVFGPYGLNEEKGWSFTENVLNTS